MENQKPKDTITCKKMAWTITNFSSFIFNVPRYSEVFTVGHCAWRLIAYRGKKDSSSSIGIHLEAADASSWPQGASVLAAFSITVVNQLSRKKSVTRGVAEVDVQCKFRANKCDWGYPRFMALSELEEPYKGYMLNDKCIVEVELFSVTSEGIEPLKDGDVVDFKDLGKIDKSLVPLLEEVCLRHLSLLDCMKNKSRRFTECAFTALGRVLQFLKDKRWKEMNDKEASEQLQQLWEELEMIRLDLSWLEPLVKSALNMKGYDEKGEKIKKLKQNLVVAETEMNIIKEKLASTEQSVQVTRKELRNAEEDFEEKDLDVEIEYERP
ncbi:protein RESTRICTED TEV MOVEMENT 3-like [Neltuma alba]|uniref:protein RESTRICTED TEV MOVEMENT 3-like n=1 Tax=Neltuma alba TaxID=207710 RepID=UPI0010A2FF52|nr:protein RESTRICTED TEV MOVEMENT 3-like [Prosopis alba]